jgi:hypothetical protein
VRLVAALAAAAVAIALTAAAARGDGDPASDYLLEQNVFFPYASPSRQVRTSLEQAADAVYAHGDRVKVALVYDANDLGAIPSLFGKPSEYARYLGVELGLWYLGPLLVVMPAGFGVYDGGRSTAAEEQVLRALPVSGGSPDELARSATSALQRLAATGSLRSPDVRAPLVTAYPASATRGKPALLRFGLYDDSGRSRARVLVYERSSLLASIASPGRFAIGTRSARVRWLVPTKLESRQLRFCVVASDAAGNRSEPACAPFLRVR